MMFREYAEAGYRVFGLHGLNKGVCGCEDLECTAFYKHPRTTAWQHTPKWSDTQIDVMEMSGQLNTGFGVLCEGYLIIDIDPRNGGDKSYKRLVKDTGLDFIELSGFTVDTGGGGQHIYFKHDGAEKLHGHLKDYLGIDFKSSGFVVGCGSMHASGNNYEVHDGFPDEVNNIPKGLFDLLVKRITSSFTVNEAAPVSEKEITELLSFIKCFDDYDEWLHVGMAIHDALSGNGFDLWHDWSSQSDKFNPDGLDAKWHSFGKNPQKITIATLFSLAKENGYIEPVTFETTLTIDTEKTQEIEKYDVNELNTNGIDLKSASGLVGDCINYINSCSRYPRESLAVSSALTAISNIGGMRFEDESYGVTPNIFCFNVAGSATGKEAIQQSHIDLTIAAGVARAIYGTIKSEQEIYRNITRNQLTGYVIDEFGITLNKIEQASKGGAASYLGGVVGALMSIYSKANGNLPLGADFAEDLLREVGKQMAAIQKMVDDNTAKQWNISRLESLTILHTQISSGFITQPYLTLSGYTTPETFNSLMTYAQATSGFMGRALLFEEKNNNPRAKKSFKKGVIGLALEANLKKLRTGGHFDVIENERIEWQHEKTIITTDDHAHELLDLIQNELHDKAENAMEVNGLEAIVRRSFELVLKVSMILAMGDGECRTADHVRWAYALVKRDLENKINLTGANMAETEKNLATEILSKVKHKLDKNNGVTLGVLSNKMRTIDKENIQKALDYLVTNGEVNKDEKQSKNGQMIINYYLV